VRPAGRLAVLGGTAAEPPGLGPGRRRQRALSAGRVPGTSYRPQLLPAQLLARRRCAKRGGLVQQGGGKATWTLTNGAPLGVAASRRRRRRREKGKAFYAITVLNLLGMGGCQNLSSNKIQGCHNT